MPDSVHDDDALAPAYQLLMERDDPELEPALDAVFGALASVNVLAGGITSPAVRKTLDLPT